jgi:hypothetical protein
MIIGLAGAGLIHLVTTGIPSTAGLPIEDLRQGDVVTVSADNAAFHYIGSDGKGYTRVLRKGHMLVITAVGNTNIGVDDTALSQSGNVARVDIRLAPEGTPVPQPLPRSQR